MKVRKRYKYGFLHLIIISLLILRFMNLEQDAPSYMISGVCQEDEVVYAITALRDYYRINNHLIAGFDKLLNGFFGYYSYPLTLLSYLIFGNNYIGLRFPLIIVSLIIIYYLFKMVTSRKNVEINLFLLLLLFSDFYFFTFSRYHNPQLYSILILTLYLYLTRINPVNYFLLGLVGAVAVLFVYPYNAFIPIAAFLGTTFYSLLYEKEKLFKNTMQLVIGGMLGISMYIITLYLTGYTIQDYFNSLMAYQQAREVIPLNIGKSLLRMVMHAANIFTTNLFRYNPILLSGFVFLLVDGIMKIINKQKMSFSEFMLWVVGMITVFQAAFINSYPFKKWIVLLPIAVLGLKMFIARAFDSIKNISVIFTLIFTIIIYLYSVKVNYSPEYWEGFEYGYYENLSSYQVVIVLLALPLFIVYLSTKKHVLAYISLIPFIYLTMYFYFFIPSYSLKEGLSSWEKEIENKPLCGDFSYSYSLYSNAIPLKNDYEFIYPYAESEKEFMQRVENRFGKEYYLTLKVMPSDKEYFHKQVADVLSLNNRKYKVSDIIKTNFYKVFLLKPL